MHVINVRNVNQALWAGLAYLAEHGREAHSRNGPVLVAPGPVTTVYEQPQERVLFDPTRDANPFFHLFESLWMLAGRDDVEFVARFVPRMREFSDDGYTLNGAYGYRWRKHFKADQIAAAVEMLQKDRWDRRVVITMYDTTKDLRWASKDVPCNTHIYLSAAKGQLDMTVCCRSNDAIWGAYGANAVHFSFLQEYIARQLNIPVGQLYQVSNNFHIYTSRPDVQRLIEKKEVRLYPDAVAETEGLLAAPDAEEPPEVRTVKRYVPLRTSGVDLYGHVAHPMPIMNTPIGIWDRDLEHFLANPTSPHFVEPWFKQVPHKMMLAWEAYKAGAHGKAVDIASEIGDAGWKWACHEWLIRRVEKRFFDVEVTRQAVAHVATEEEKANLGKGGVA